MRKICFLFLILTVFLAGQCLTPFKSYIYFSLSLGTDIKLSKLKIAPEFALNYNLTADDPDTQNRTETNYDLQFSVGIFYTP